MDRRDFLKVGGAAAVTVGGAGTATAQSAPAILPGATELRLASPDLPDVPGFGPDRLARRIELATGGRYRITATPDATTADLVFGERQSPARPASRVRLLRRPAAWARPRRDEAPDVARRRRRPDAVGRSGRPVRIQAAGGGAYRAEWRPVDLPPPRDCVGSVRRPHACRGPGGRGRAGRSAPRRCTWPPAICAARWPRAASTRPSCWSRWFWRRPTCSRWPSVSTAPASMPAAPLLSLDVRTRGLGPPGRGRPGDLRGLRGRGLCPVAGRGAGATR